MTALVMWTIYDHPRDFPDHFVMRRGSVDASGIRFQEIGGIYDTLESARADVPLGLACITRHPSDDPVIVETWF